MSKAGWFFAAMLGLASASGCGGGKYLTWKASPPAAAPVGKMAIDVQDGRAIADKRVIGRVPGYAHIPTDVELDKATDVADGVHDLIAQAAQAAGLGVLAAGDTSPTARIKAEVTQFHCSVLPIPFAPHQATVGIKLYVMTLANDTPVGGEFISAEDSGSGCQDAFKGALSKAFEKVTGTLGAPAVKEAAKGGAAPAPVAAPPTAAAPAATP